jgi:hypothetical protein
LTKKILDESEPNSESGERAMRITKAALPPLVVTGAALAGAGMASVVPAIAAAAAFIAEDLWVPHIRMRKNAIINEVAAKVKDIDRRLLDSEAFIDALGAGVQAAVKTSSQVKREALRNAIVNSVSPMAPSLVKQQQFFALRTDTASFT